MDGAVVVRANGGPEVLEWTRSDPGQPGPGEVLIRHTAVGLNFIDVYQREGLYPLDLPFTPGMEGAGRVEAVGEGVGDLTPGDAVAYTGSCSRDARWSISCGGPSRSARVMSFCCTLRPAAWASSRVSG